MLLSLHGRKERASGYTPEQLRALARSVLTSRPCPTRQKPLTVCFTKGKDGEPDRNTKDDPRVVDPARKEVGLFDEHLQSPCSQLPGTAPQTYATGTFLQLTLTKAS